MTDIEKIREWLTTYPKWSDLMNKFHVDFTDAVPNNGGIFPSGITESGRKEDIIGNVVITCQYNFAIYCVLEKPTDDDIAALSNADLVMDLQQWVQNQSATHHAPTFGDEPLTETLKAQNGVMYGPSEDGTTAMYMIQLSAEFTKNY